jgi:hypothetical protein
MPLNELPGGLKSGAISLPTEDLKEFDIAMRTTMQGMSAFTERYDKFNVDVQQINEAITAAFQQLAMVAVDAFADMVESMVAGGEGMKDIGPKMLAAIGGIMEDLGKQFIVIGALGKLFASAVESMQWYVALGAGIALVAAGAALKGIAQQSVKPQGMAEGGVVPSGFPGDTYPARLTSGEMVIPPHKLDSVMGGRQVVVLETQVRGEDIYFIQKKISSKHDRYT